jgi:hypothetical protein
MEWERSSSRRLDPARTDKTLRAMSRSRDGFGHGPGSGRAGDTKLQHFATIYGGWIANPMTVWGIHGNVIPELFPALIFCSKIFRFQRKQRFRPE